MSYTLRRLPGTGNPPPPAGLQPTQAARAAQPSAVLRARFADLLPLDTFPEPEGSLSSPLLGRRGHRASRRRRDLPEVARAVGTQGPAPSSGVCTP